MVDHNLGDFSVEFVTPEGDIQKERYQMTIPKLIVGNLVIGERYVEPQGPVRMENKNTGDVCDIMYKYRGVWSTAEHDKKHVSATIRNKDGQEKFRLHGNYDKEIMCTDLQK